MITVSGIHKRFGRVRAVRGVSFEIPRGQVVGLLGANGAGKTTTMRIITGSIPPDAGTVTIDGLDVVERALDARRRVGYLPESAPAHAEMLVREYLDFRGRLFGMARTPRRTAIDRVIQTCQLRDVRRRRVGHLSKGYRQRVGLASALLHDPPVLVLDEPTNGLDPTQIREARTLIRTLASDRAVLVSSHILPEVEATSDRIIIMAAGLVRADAPTGHLLPEGGNGARPCLVEVRITESGGVEGVVATMRLIPGAKHVEMISREGPWVRLRIIPEAGDLRADIGEAATTAGLVIRELHHETPSLERLFMDVVAEARSDNVTNGEGQQA